MPKYQTVRDLSQQLGVHPQTIRAWVHEGRIEAVQLKPKSKFLFHPETVEALRRQGSTLNVAE